MQTTQHNASYILGTQHMLLLSLFHGKTIGKDKDS